MALIVLAFIAFNTGGNSTSTSYEVSSEEDDNTNVANVSGSSFAEQNDGPAANNTGDPISFARVLLSLQQRKIDTAKMELQKARTAPQGSEAAQIRMAGEAFINFYEKAKGDLKNMVPPVELCKGKYLLVESNPPKKIVIRVEGNNLHFSIENPQRSGYDLFEIMYHHYKMTAGPGNLQHDLGYAAYLLFTECDDLTSSKNKALKLLNDVQANGSPRDREAAQALKTLFKLQ